MQLDIGFHDFLGSVAGWSRTDIGPITSAQYERWVGRILASPRHRDRFRFGVLSEAQYHGTKFVIVRIYRKS